MGRFITTKHSFRALPPRLTAQWSRLSKSLGMCFVVLFLAQSSRSFSQVSTGYTWSYVTTPAHALMTGGTPIVSGVGTAIDDAIYPNIPIGFTANFNGIDYTTVGVSTNGFLWFGSTNPAVTEYAPISSTTAMEGVIAGYAANLVGRGYGSTTTIQYKLTGTCPNRIFTVEWTNMLVSGTPSATSSLFSPSPNRTDIQITITESSNNIDIHPYDYNYLVTASYFGQVGLRGSSNSDFKNRSVVSCVNGWNPSVAGASNTATCQIDGATCSTYPATNARYRFTNLSAVSGVSWNGNVNSDWFTGANWSTGLVPTIYYNVNIPAGAPNYPVLTGATNANCRNLTIASGASLTTDLTYSGTFTVGGNLSNDGTLSNNGTNYISLKSAGAATISGTGNYTTADFSLSGNCTSYSLSNNIVLRKLTIGTGSTLSMNTFNLTIYSAFTQTGTINQSTGVLQIEAALPVMTNTTFNENTGTTYFATGINTTASNQTVPSITYYNLKVNTNSGFTASIGNGSTVTCNNLTIENAAGAGGIAAGINAITVNANFDLGPTGTSFAFNLSNNITITGNTRLYQGVITTNTSRMIINNSSAASLSAGAGNTDYSLSYVNGNLRRLILSGTSANYDFPLGDASTAHYIVMMDNALSGVGFTYIDGYFAPLSNHADVDMVATEPAEPGVYYDQMSPEGVWFLNPDNQPTAGTYSVKAYLNGFSGLVDDEFAVLKRISTSITGADWENGGAAATRPSSMQPGRTVADGYALRDGLTSFSQFGIARSVNLPLPIELLSFRGEVKGSVNLLEWMTATETNNDYFTIERSTDASDFRNILTVNGAGNSIGILNYAATDNEPLSGLSYYRLKQTDFDGQFSYSSIISLYRNASELEFINAFNAPDQGSLEINIGVPAAGSLHVELYSAKGKSLFSRDEKAEKGLVKINIPTFGLPKGLYILKISNGQQMVSRKMAF